MIFSRRKNFIINRDFQISFISQMLFICFLTAATSFSIITYFINDFISHGEKLNLPQGHPFYLLIREQQEYLLNISLIAYGILIAFIIIFGIFISHRIAGPIYKITNLLNDYKKGDGKLIIKTRKNDYFKELVTALNTYIDKSEIKE